MMNKTILCIALGSACIVTATSAVALLPDNAILAIDAGVGSCEAGGTYPSCTYGATTVNTGSYFAMDTNADGFTNNERVVINAPGTDGGITLAGAQTGHGIDGPTEGSVDGDGNPIGTPLTPGQIDGGWDFFGSHGWHTTSAAPTIASDNGAGDVTLGMTGFTVHWNGGDIDMGQGANAVLTCAVDCADGDTYTLEYTATVPTGSFAGVQYQLHLEGTITLPLATNDAPIAVPDAATVDRKAPGRPYTPSVIDILFNDVDANGTSDIDRTTVDPTPAGTGTAGGNFTIDENGDVTYTPPDDFIGDDTFTYNVTDKGGPAGAGSELSSNEALVTITVQNALPVAVNDTASLDTSISASMLIDVLNNDTDSDGTIVTTTVNIDTIPANGTAVADAVTGGVTYTPAAGFIGIDEFSYTVQDNDTVVSNSATVVITVSAGSGILPDSAFLIINAGTGVPGEGTYFTMEVNPGNLTGVGLTGFDHIQLSVAQPASAVMPSIDEPWQFFGNLGVSQTTAPINILTDDSGGNVTLDFSGWDVSWNNIVSIPMGEGADNGIAAMTCAVDCAIGDTFSIIYRATVPDGDPSGFGNVQYILHMDGVISDQAPTVGGGDTSAPYRVTDAEPIVAVDDSSSSTPSVVSVTGGLIATAAGKSAGTNLTAADIGIKDPSLNPNDGEQCIGGCTDFVATGVTTDFIDIVFKLNKPLPSGTVFRKLLNGKWGNFDISDRDQVGTANADAAGNCQGPEGKYNTGLREGASCVFLRIYDNGPNDTDNTVGTIADPSGALFAGSSNVPAGSTDSAISGLSWLSLAAIIASMGLVRIKRM